MRTFVLFVCVLLAGCGSVETQRPRGRTKQTQRTPRRQQVSPIGGYVIKAETPDRKKPERDIVITKPGEKREILRFPFQRNVDVVWAPDESGVAVVDLVLENETRVVVFELPSGRPLYELRRDHVCQINPQLPCGEAYTRVYFSNVVWMAPDRIQVTLDMMNPLERDLPSQIHTTLAVPFPR